MMLNTIVIMFLYNLTALLCKAVYRVLTNWLHTWHLAHRLCMCMLMRKHLCMFTWRNVPV